MVLTASTMMPLGTQAPDFSLQDTVSQKVFSLKELHSTDFATVIMFICNHCPFVVHIQEKLVEVAKHYQTQGIRFIAISSNDIREYPEDAPDKMKDVAEKWHYPFPHL